MDQELYEALQKAYQRRQGRLRVLSPESESDEDRKAFDRFVSRSTVLYQRYINCGIWVL